MGYLRYYLIEVGHLVCGFLPIIVFVKVFGPRHWMMLVMGNLGALVSGYVYTSRTYKLLFQQQAILERVDVP